MTLLDITCFLKLAETLNYTKTAEELFISQPAVTRHINTLEDELKIKLFDRSVKRNIVLTEEGQIYLKGLKKCAKIYSDTLAALSFKALQNPLIINFLRGINATDDFVEITGQFMVTHPNFHHFTHFIDSELFDAAIEKGEIIICQSEYAPGSKGYNTLRLTKEPVPHFLIANDKHPGFTDADSPDFEKIRNTTLFLPKDLPDTLKKKYLSHTKELLGGDPLEIMYLDSMDSVELFLRSGRCFTIASGWNTLLQSNHLKSYEMDFASHYVAILDKTKCTYPFANEYLEGLKGCL